MKNAIFLKIYSDLMLLGINVVIQMIIKSIPVFLGFACIIAGMYLCIFVSGLADRIKWRKNH